MKNLHYYPMIVLFWFPVTFAITYIMAVELKDVPPLYPYISDTGNFSPESCIFGQLLNMGSLFMAFVIYVRYRQVRFLCESHGLEKKIRSQNRNSLNLGLIGSLGISIVANFQETNVFFVHLFGAFLAFGLGSVYMIYATQVSFSILPIFGTKSAINTRVLFTVLCSSCYMICSVSAVLSFIEFDGKDMTKWNANDAGYQYHVVSSITEWITAFSMMFYIATYTNDFKYITMDESPVFVVYNSVSVAHIEPERY